VLSLLNDAAGSAAEERGFWSRYLAPVVGPLAFTHLPGDEEKMIR